MTPAVANPLLAQPGDAIGILGGGQLGRMLAMAAADLGLDVHILTPETDSPASRVAAKTIVAAYDDIGALKEFASAIKVSTLEFENVPVAAVDAIMAAGVPVRPDSRALSVAQDRLAEKTFFTGIGISPAPFRRIDAAGEIGPMLAELGGSGVMKTRFSGYDGKGQVRLKGVSFTSGDANAAWASVNGAPCVIEGWVEHVAEISVVIARAADGSTRAFDPPQNIHEGGVLRRSIFPAILPANFSPALLDEARAMAEKLAQSLDYVGVLALELFVTKDGHLLANEFAPRVHNSGHWTAEACYCGQFEQHIRAVCGWPLGDPSRHSDGEMINLLGDDASEWANHLEDRSHLRLYGKRRQADGRKMGHVVKLRPLG